MVGTFGHQMVLTLKCKCTKGYNRIKSGIKISGIKPGRIQICGDHWASGRQWEALQVYVQKGHSRIKSGIKVMGTLKCKCKKFMAEHFIASIFVPTFCSTMTFLHLKCSHHFLFHLFLFCFFLFYFFIPLFCSSHFCSAFLFPHNLSALQLSPLLFVALIVIPLFIPPVFISTFHSAF